MNCIFCKIISGDIPSYTIYEDDIVKCFLDVNPENPGHTLIIPKKHYQDIKDIDNNTLYHISDVSKKMYDLLKEKLNFDGLRYVQNNGNIQEVKHYHLHLIPFYNEKPNMTVEEVYNLLKK